jgi:hypothetical protein
MESSTGQARVTVVHKMLRWNLVLIVILLCLVVLAASLEGPWTPYVFGGSGVVYAAGTCIMFIRFGMLRKLTKGHVWYRFIFGIMMFGALYGIVVLVIATLYMQ